MQHLSGEKQELFIKKISAVERFLEVFPDMEDRFNNFFPASRNFTYEEILSLDAIEHFDALYRIYNDKFINLTFSSDIRRMINAKEIDVKELLKAYFKEVALFTIYGDGRYNISDESFETIIEIADIIGSLSKRPVPDDMPENFNRQMMYQIHKNFVATLLNFTSEIDCGERNNMIIKALLKSESLKTIQISRDYGNPHRRRLDTVINNAIACATEAESVIKISEFAPDFIGYTYAIFNDNICESKDLHKKIREEFFDNSKKKNMQGALYTKLLESRTPKYLERLLDILVYKNNRCRCKEERAADLLMNLLVFDDAGIGKRYAVSLDPESNYHQFVSTVVTPIMEKHPELYNECLFKKIANTGRRSVKSEYRKALAILFFPRLKKATFEEVSTRFKRFPTVYSHIINMSTDVNIFTSWVDSFLKEHGLKGLITMLNLIGNDLCATSYGFTSTGSSKSYVYMMLKYAAIHKIPNGISDVVDIVNKSEEDLSQYLNPVVAELIIDNVISTAYSSFIRAYNPHSKTDKARYWYSGRHSKVASQDFTASTDPSVVASFLSSVDIQFKSDAFLITKIPKVIWKLYRRSVPTIEDFLRPLDDGIDYPARPNMCKISKMSLSNMFILNSHLGICHSIERAISGYVANEGAYYHETNYMFPKVLYHLLDDEARAEIANIIKETYASDNIESFNALYFNTMKINTYSTELSGIARSDYLDNASEFAGEPSAIRMSLPAPILIERIFTIQQNNIKIFIDDPEVNETIEAIKIYTSLLAMG